MEVYMTKSNGVRAGLKDIWNSYMVKRARFTDSDIPFCPTTGEIPESIITWTGAKALYKNHPEMVHSAYVCFYEDDQKFDGEKGLWKNPKYALQILRQFAGAITPDFSTYQDFPDPIKRYNVYRMRAIGFWFSENGIKIINNVRWGTEETYDYCFDGLPDNSILAIGTVGGSPRKVKDRERFESGLRELVNRKHPQVLIIYGSDHYPVFRELENQGIRIVSFKSKTAADFERICNV